MRDLPPLADSISCDSDVHRRPGIFGGGQIRRRDVVAWCRRVAGGFLVLELYRFSGASSADSVPGKRRQAGGGAYHQWLGTWASPHFDRGDGELPERGW